MVFPEIDKTKTAANVRKFLKNDYLRAVRLAGENPGALRSVVMDGMPGKQFNEFDRDKSIIDHLSAEEIISSVVQATKCLVKGEDRLGNFFLARYGDRLQLIEIEEKYGYSAATINRELKTACCYFADYYYSITGIELQVYK